MNGMQCSWRCSRLSSRMLLRNARCSDSQQGVSTLGHRPSVRATPHVKYELLEAVAHRRTNHGGGLTLGEADKQIGRHEAAGSNSYRSSIAKALARLAAYPMALDRLSM